MKAKAMIRAGELLGFTDRPYTVVSGIRVHNPPIIDPNAVPNVAHATEITENRVRSFKDIQSATYLLLTQRAPPNPTINLPINRTNAESKS